MNIGTISTIREYIGIAVALPYRILVKRKLSDLAGGPQENHGWAALQNARLE